MKPCRVSDVLSGPAIRNFGTCAWPPRPCLVFICITDVLVHGSHAETLLVSKDRADALRGMCHSSPAMFQVQQALSETADPGWSNSSGLSIGREDTIFLQRVHIGIGLHCISIIIYDMLRPRTCRSSPHLLSDPNESAHVGVLSLNSSWLTLASGCCCATFSPAATLRPRREPSNCTRSNFGISRGLTGRSFTDAQHPPTSTMENFTRNSL